MSNISFSQKRFPSGYIAAHQRYSIPKKQQGFRVNNTLDLNHSISMLIQSNFQNLSIISKRSENIVRFSEEAAMKKTEETLSEKELKTKLLKYIDWLFRDSKRKLKQELRQIEEQLDDETDIRLFKKVRYFLVSKIKSRPL